MHLQWHMKKWIYLLSLVLVGCVNSSGAYLTLNSVTAPVIAILSDDLFVGVAVGYRDRTGTLDIASTVDPSIRCLGEFRYTGSNIGEGKVTCNDGNEARFQFNKLSMMSGYGIGVSSRRGGMSFTYGLTADDALQYLHLPANTKLKTNNGRLILI